MIDLHVHVLPGVDDGARDPGETRAMLARARDLGFAGVVATPHLMEPLSREYAARVVAALGETRALATEIGVDLWQGFEVMLTPDVPHRLEQGDPLTLGGTSAILVEVPFAGWPLHAEATLFALQAAGYRPVLAHPERYAAVQADQSLAIELAGRGVILQLSLSSLTGMFGRGAQRAAEALLRAGAIGVAASDAHGPGHRYAAVPAAIDRLRGLVGDEGVTTLLEDGPRAVIDGGAMPVTPRVEGGETGAGWWERGRRILRRDGG